MKLTKFASLATVATFALGVYSVKAITLDTTTNYSTLTFTMTIKQQTNDVVKTSGNVVTTTYNVTTKKLGNKQILNALADMFDTNWPTGAQLIYDWNSDQVCVADKHGTNILFYCGDGVIDPSRDAYLIIDWFDEDGPYTGKLTTNNVTAASSETLTLNEAGEVQIYYYNYDGSFFGIDMEGYGQNISTYTEKWTSTTDTWTDKEAFSPLLAFGYGGDGNAIMTGSITANGKGKK